MMSCIIEALYVVFLFLLIVILVMIIVGCMRSNLCCSKSKKPLPRKEKPNEECSD